MYIHIYVPVTLALYVSARGSGRGEYGLRTWGGRNMSDNAEEVRQLSEALSAASQSDDDEAIVRASVTLNNRIQRAMRERDFELLHTLMAARDEGSLFAASYSMLKRHDPCYSDSREESSRGGPRAPDRGGEGYSAGARAAWHHERKQSRPLHGTYRVRIRSLLAML